MNLSSANVEYPPPQKKKIIGRAIENQRLKKKQLNLIYVIRVNVLILIRINMSNKKMANDSKLSDRSLHRNLVCI